MKLIIHLNKAVCFRVSLAKSW